MTSGVACSHLDQVAILDLPAHVAGCEECLKIGSSWLHLRMCQTCGKIGCCDSSPNRHARAHAAEAEHPTSGVLAVALDLCSHEAVARHSDGRDARVPLAPNRSVGTVTRDLLAAVRSLGGPFEIDPVPQETPWRTPLDEDEEHARYDTDAVARYFASATRAALVLAALRAPYRGRATPVNAWWGSFDLAVSLYSGAPAEPPSGDFITRNAMDAEEVAVGWWPGDRRYPQPAFYAYAHPAPPGFADATLSPPAARWNATLGEYILDWEDVRSADNPHGAALEFARSAVRHACAVCGLDVSLAASADGRHPAIV